MESHPVHRPNHCAKSERDSDSLYPFNELGFNLNDVEERYKGVLAPMTIHLTPPCGHKDVEAEANKMELKRPVTPIEDEIKIQPKTLNKLAKLVRRRIVPQLDSLYLIEDEQKQLSAILMGEVNSIWADFRNQVSDPFLSTEDNKELHRRITVHLVTVCESLFNEYLTKVHILNKRGVFSGPANMSRLKAQLALDASRLLNVAVVRRHLLRKMKGQEVDGCLLSERSWKPRCMASAQPSIAASDNKWEPLHRRSLHKAGSVTSLQNEIEQMKSSMPPLDAEKLLMIFHNLPEKLAAPPADGVLPPISEMIYASLKPVNQQPREKISTKSIIANRKRSEISIKQRIIFKKCKSVPTLCLGETLLQELGVEDDDEGMRRAGSLNNLSQFPVSADHLNKDLWDKPVVGRRERLAADLKSLLRSTCDDGLEDMDDEDLPPLLQTIVQSQKHDGRKEVLEQQLEELDEKEKKRIEEETIILKRPAHPQPTTVTQPMPNNMVVRTNDVRVSERICLSNITLKPYTTVYNDLIDEIDATTVKQMDSSLFLGDEITEVYKEIMKTVPRDHLDLENDALVETSADIVNLSAAFSSSSLSKRREDRVVNVQLQQRSEPPWGSESASNWVKTPQNPPRDKKGQPLIIPQTPRGDPIKTCLGLGNTIMQSEREQQAARLESMGEVMAKSYSSWLSWWKSVMNTEDYMKYISAQESDYLGVVFHFYDSGDEDDHDTLAQVPSKQVTRQRLHEEKQKRLGEIWKAKTSFTPGEWNVQSVMLGGLGKDPELTELEIQHQPAPSEEGEKASLKVIDPKMKVITKKAKRIQSMCEGGDTYQPHAHRDSVYPRSTRHSTDTVQTRKELASIQLNLQERLEKVWKSLHMPDSLKLDMAVKYSADTYHAMLEEAVDEWERVTDLIQQRELLLTSLEKFERQASDPSRFFERGQRGSAVARLDEARSRSAFYKRIESLDVDILKVLNFVVKTFDDVVTYQGRSYRDKMKWDRTEMLYWLQEERKKQLFHDHNLNHNPNHNLAPTPNRRLSAVKFASVPPITVSNHALIPTKHRLEISVKP